MIGLLECTIMTKSMARTLPEWKAGNSVEAKVIRWGRTEGTDGGGGPNQGGANTTYNCGKAEVAKPSTQTHA